MRSEHFVLAFEGYKFEEKVKEIKTIINDKRDKIQKNILEEFEKTLNEIPAGCKKMIEKVNHDYEEHAPILGGITLVYLENIDKPGVNKNRQRYDR